MKPSVVGGYTPERAANPAWDYVGMLGALLVHDDGTCISGGFTKCGENGVATAAEKQGFNTFFVLSRKTEDTIEILMR